MPPATESRPNRLPRSQRLRGQSFIGLVFKTGRYHGLGTLQAKTLLRNDGGPSRFMISIRKSVGSAPVRNRIRRVVREAIRLNQHQLRGSFDVCLFLTRPPELPLRLAKITPEILRLFSRLNAAGNDVGNGARRHDPTHD